MYFKKHDWLGPKEVALLLGITRNALDYFVKLKIFPAPTMEIGITQRWSRNDVLMYLGMLRPRCIPAPLPHVRCDGLIPDCMADMKADIKEWRSSGSVVYFLLDADTVVYVGQTGDLGGRLGGHTDKVYDRVLYVRVRSEDALRVEAFYILRFLPKYNARNGSRARQE